MSSATALHSTNIEISPILSYDKGLEKEEATRDHKGSHNQNLGLLIPN